MKVRSPKRPKKVVVGPVRARAIRSRASTAATGDWYWRAEVHRDATTLTVWNGWATRAVVEETLARLLTEGTLFDAPEADPEPVRTTRDLMETWVAAQEDRGDLSDHTVRGYRNAARQVVTVIGDVLLDHVDVSTLHRFRDTRLRAGGATGTVDMELGVVRMAWRWGREIGVCPVRDLPHVPVNVKPTRNRRTPSTSEVTAVLGAMTGWSRLAVRLLFATGARIGEIAGLTWRDLDLDEGVLRVDGKTGERLIPVEPAVVAELRALRGDAPGGAGVFGVNPRTVKGQIRVRYLPRACEAAGVPVFSAHGLRRAAADTYARAGVDVGTAAALLGHSPKVMLEHYRQVTLDDRRRAVARARLGHLDENKVLHFPKAGAEE